ncbi:MAG TPA: BrnA antitoxin family protein [Blastocatellia bacterium]|nr:BrnA antitoxin family protein [Blastocatellia bacterium]
MKKKTDERTVMITEADYQDAVAHGVDPEYAIKPGRYKVRRNRFLDKLRPEDAEAQNIKVRVTIWLDGDIVEHFKERAARPDAAPYQTQINNALREYIEKRPVRADQALLPQDEAFIAALADAVAARINKMR